MKKTLRLTPALLILAVMFAIIISPKIYTDSCVKGLTLWALTVLPSLLPFFFLSSLLTKSVDFNFFSKKLSPLSKKLFRCNGNCIFVFFNACLCGYPLGAKLTSELFCQGLLTEKEAKVCACLSSVSGPIFIIGAVGSAMLGSAKIGVILYLSHFCSCIVCAFVSKFIYKPTPYTPRLLNAKNSENPLYESIYNSVISVMIVGGFIAVFYVLGDILINLKIVDFIASPLYKLIGKDTARGLVLGIVESSRGCRELSFCPTPLTASLCGAIISFGGLSVLFQSFAFLSKCKVKFLPFIAFKFLQAILCFAFSLLFFKIS